MDLPLPPPLRTRWCVITGAPCSGKTTVIDILARQGFQTALEEARAYIDEELDKGRTIEEIRSDLLTFERNILHRKIRSEEGLPREERVFLDRALPDSVAYYRMDGLDPEEPLAFARKYRYERVFFFEPLKFQKDRVRAEDEERAQRLDWLLSSAYHSLGYDLIRVPVVSIPERVRLVLTALNDG